MGIITAMANYDMSSYDTYNTLAPMTDGDRLAGVVSHGAALLALPLVVPVIVWLCAPMFATPRYVRHAALQALLFQLVAGFFIGLLGGTAGMFFAAPFITGAVPILGLIFGPLTALIGWPLAAAFGIAGAAVFVWAFVIEAIAVWKSFKGEPYRMPIVGGIGG